jgi:hypothetical protein
MTTRSVLRALVVIVSIAGCGPCTRGPANLTPMKCHLEDDVLPLVGNDATPCGNEQLNGGVCGTDCEERIRTCVLAATRDRRSFYAIWSNNYRDGFGTRRAVFGLRGADGSYGLRWFAYELHSGYDRSTKIGPTRTRWTSMVCDEIGDLHGVCSRDEEPSDPGCRPSRNERYLDLELACRGAVPAGSCEDAQ